ncbi:MAG: ATP F0F1 synthase subunit B [Hyphomicrobiales bacterium]|nr:MAG: ATP F0F1 synthase subunit B [Hyphomicrobiales bacterium]
MDATFWATVALFIFLAGMVYIKVPGMITKNLDGRADKIRSDLDEARRLREEAQELLAEYQRKRKEAEKEAEGIIAAAKREADALSMDAARKMEEFVERRTIVAEQKIEQAEAQALTEVRASAIDMAMAAAEQIIGSKVTGKTASDLISKGIAEVKAKLH